MCVWGGGISRQLGPQVVPAVVGIWVRVMVMLLGGMKAVGVDGYLAWLE